MSRRRAKTTAALTRVETDVMPVSARVAWSYLAAFVASVIAGGTVVLSNQVFAPLVCRDPAPGAIADCKVAWAIWVALAAFLLASIPVALKAHLDVWFVGALWALVGLWVAFDDLEHWWWWASAAVMPAAAALISAPWGSQERVRWIQRGVIIALLVGAVGALVWWYLRG